MGCNLSNQEAYDVQIENQLENRKNIKKCKKINGRISQHCQVYQNIQPSQKITNCYDLSLIDNVLSNHFLFYKLSKSQRLELIGFIQGYTANKNDYIFKQGDLASLFFIINTGKVAIEINGNQIKTISTGQYFGQLALLYTAPRSASVKALENCFFWCLSQTNFKKTLEIIVKKNYQLAKIFVQKISIFNYLTPKQKNSIAYNMHTLKYEDNQIIFRQGDDANSLYAIVSGEVQLNVPSKNKLILKSGDSFGENSLKQGQIRSGTAKSIGQTQCLTIGKQVLKNCLGDQFEQLRYTNIIKWSLKRSQNFKYLQSTIFQKLILLFQIVKYQDQQIIISKGTQPTKLIICLDGKINNQQIGQVINQKYLEIQNYTIQEDYIKCQKGCVAIATFNAISQLFQGNFAILHQKKLENQIQRNQNNSLTLKINQSQNQLKLSDFNIAYKLGQGQFGKVYMVQNKKNSNEQFAIKCIQKNMIIKNQMQIFIKQQKDILEKINFPLIVQLEKTYKDQHFIYLLMSYIQGGDFFDILREIGILSSNIAKFYTGCLLLCIQYLHSKNILYRDLKPQNAVVDEEGYLYMIDLGTAKILTQQTGFRTFTIIGTPHYMAPQVIQGKGYGFSSDIWSLGVVLYEMVCGYLPYGQDLDDPYDIYKQIQKSDIKFPKHYKDQKGKQLIKRLMIKNQDSRSIQNFSIIKNMPYFHKLDWQNLIHKNIKVPYKPKKKQYNDKKFINYPLITYINRQKKLLGKPLISTINNWDSEF